MKHIEINEVLNLKAGEKAQWGNKNFYFSRVENNPQWIECYSYSTIIATILVDQKKLSYTTEKYSRTTSKQLTQLKNAVISKFDFEPVESMFELACQPIFA